MQIISEEGQDLISRLIMWEMLGQEDVDPKVLLRQMSLADLSILAENLSDEDAFAMGSASARLVLLEMHYRMGRLADDWDLQRDGKELTLVIKPLAPVRFIRMNFLVEATC